jgi:hypothetical protein
MMKLDIDLTSICVVRAHRLGKVNPGKTRPIIVCFNDYRTVEHILSRAYKLKGKYNFGINRDYPKEIVEARSHIWPKYKEERSKYPPKTVYIGYPAKVIVKNRVVQDKFPLWKNVMQMSRSHRTHVGYRRYHHIAT